MNARCPNGLELRAAPDVRATGRQLVGYAATFDTPALIGGYTETIKPGAFRAALLRPGLDVLALMDHDPTRLLARTSSGTLRLSEDARGLAFALDLPDTGPGRDALALAERGDLGGMSFGFRVQAEQWPDATTRMLLAVDLVEVSVVQAFPAYGQTTVAARSRDADLEVVRRRYRTLSILGVR